MSEQSSRSNIVFNILGGCLTLLSLQLPWLIVSGPYGFNLQPGSLYIVAFYWPLAGGILSFVSRYSGFFTLVGMFAFLGEPYASFRSTGTGLGVLIAFTGALFTFAGERWSIPTDMVKGREILGGILYTVGFLILLTITVSMFVYGSVFTALESQLIIQIPLTLVGVFLTIRGLRMYLSPERKYDVRSSIYQE